MFRQKVWENERCRMVEDGMKMVAAGIEFRDSDNSPL
jgi:hypothetical protein